MNKTLAFHASTNYQIQAPAPYDNDVHHDLHRDLARIGNTEYESEFDFHVDVYTSFKKVNDGHCGVYSRCFDCQSLFEFVSGFGAVSLTFLSRQLYG